MSNKHLRRRASGPTDGSAWWYETPRGIEIYTAMPNRLVLIIPWNRIRTALARKDRP